MSLRRFQQKLDVKVFGQIILIFLTVGVITYLPIGTYTLTIL